MSPGDKVKNFMKSQGIKEKDLFKLCTDVTYQFLNEGEFPCLIGESDLQSRKMMILLQGSVSVLHPIPPMMMLNFI